MSFADSVRGELISAAVKRPCCKKALVCGMLAGAEREGACLSLSLRDGDVAEFAAETVRKTYCRSPELLPAVVRGRKGWNLSFSSPAAADRVGLMEEFGKDPGAPEKADADEQSRVDAVIGISCECCRSSFLRGAFLTLATVNDPHRSTHLEFSVRHTERTAFLRAFLTSCGYPPGIIRRAGGDGLYYKDSGSAEDLIAMAGAGKTAMEMMNIRIEREIRNQENRATNCVAKNIEKSVSAASRQLAAIEKLALTGMLAQLPEPIRLTARLRAENPDATLEELRMLHEPPITKSGLNHRLQKLLDMADKTGL